VATLSLLLSALVAINLAAAWKRYQLEPTERMLLYHDLDARLFHKARLELVERPYAVIFGSSRAMALSSSALGMQKRDFYNAAVGGATIEDYIGLWSLLTQQGKIPEVAVFSVEVWQFDRTQPPARWRSLQGEVSRFLDRIGAKEDARWLPIDEIVYRWDSITELVSFTVLRTSIRELRRARAAPARRAYLAQAFEREENYGKRAVATDAELRRRAVEFALAGGDVRAAYHWDARRARWLLALWRDMAAHGVRVFAYMPPYHPAAWRILASNTEHARAFEMTEQFVRRATPAPLERFANFSDPASVPCGEADFFDGSHQNAECLSRMFSALLQRS